MPLVQCIIEAEMERETCKDCSHAEPRSGLFFCSKYSRYVHPATSICPFREDEIEESKLKKKLKTLEDATTFAIKELDDLQNKLGDSVFDLIELIKDRLREALK